MTPWLDDGDVRLYHGDALDQLALMPSESVHCIVTSPPFWGLRDYGMPGQIGLEETPDEWCARLVSVFREARRVLRNDGCMWLECGDTYASSGERVQNGWDGNNKNPDGSARTARHAGMAMGRSMAEGLKPKDLCGAPWLLAFALRADGWYLRSDTIWARPNPMPESVTDRPTKAHSYVFLLTKSARYFYDADAIREPHTPDGRKVTTRTVGNGSHDNYQEFGHEEGRERWPNGGRNARSVWSIPTEPTPFAHFATFPTELVARCIKAGTSEHGSCSECGAPWRRITERETINAQATNNSRKDDPHEGRADGDQRRLAGQATPSVTTLGWEPSCAHGSDDEHATQGAKCNALGCLCGHAPYITPCRVLDPFMGSGTTALVARRLGRHAIGIELNAEYLRISAERLQQPTLWSQPV